MTREQLEAHVQFKMDTPQNTEHFSKLEARLRLDYFADIPLDIDLFTEELFEEAKQRLRDILIAKLEKDFGFNVKEL